MLPTSGKRQAPQPDGRPALFLVVRHLVVSGLGAMATAAVGMRRRHIHGHASADHGTQNSWRDRLLTRVVVAALALSASVARVNAAETAIDFARDVAPIFEQHCIRCHQPSNKQGDLLLSTPDDLAAKDYVDRERPAESYLLEMVTAAAGARPQMPKEGTALTADEVATLRRWIAAGAHWPKDVVVRERAKADRDWWSLRPLPKHAEPPKVSSAQTGADWSQNPIDRFVLAKLREKGLQPSLPAEKATLIRRATYDLLGLPPTPEEIAAFSADQSPDAYGRLVDRLLASPHYGERWGRHWLDVIRFGESRGYERNLVINNLWPFRDYVIRSFNADKPFDQFIREHLAGDVIGKDQPEVEVGAAFLVAGPYDDVNNNDLAAKAQIRADTLDEMIRATSEAFLGLTVGCARCHNHKFDPILQRDYYALYSTFAGVVHGERPVATNAEKSAHAAALEPLEKEQRRLLGQRETIDKELESRVAAREAEVAKSWTRERASRYGTEERFAPVEARYVRLRVEGSDAPSDKSERKYSFRLDEFEVWTAESEPRNVALATSGGRAAGLAAREAKDVKGAYGAALVIDGRFGERWIAGGKELRITLARPERIDRVLFSSDRPRALGESHEATTFVGDYWVDVSLDGKHWVEVASSIDRLPASLGRKQERLLKIVMTDDDRARLAAIDRELAKVNKAIDRVPPLPSWWVGKRQAAPGPFQTFAGGDPQRPGETVVAASLAALDGRTAGYRLDAKAPEAERRLALANWLVSADNPLVSRVLANRVWHYHFGCGLVDSPSDFGYMGGRPSHPELLDYLARRLLADGWRLKPLHRLIMMSEAYQQSSTWRAEPSRLDADSRMLWRYPPRRLEAEELRDALLAVSGSLQTRLGGPGFRLYEYEVDNVATYVPLDVQGPETYRRAVYHQNARASRVDLLGEFDCPDNSFSAPRRAATTTPLQSLTLLNHSFVLDMAAALAARLESERPSDVQAQIDRAFWLTLGRSPEREESDAAAKLIGQHGLRAFCRALFNANEFVYVRECLLKTFTTSVEYRKTSEPRA